MPAAQPGEALLARALLQGLPDRGPLFAYNAPFERGVMEGLAERVPALALELKDAAGRFVLVVGERRLRAIDHDRASAVAR